MALALRLFLSIIVVVMATALPRLEPSAQAAGLNQKDKAVLKQATRFFKQGSYEQAAQLLADLVVDHPEMANLQRNLGACYYYLRRPEPALSNLRAYLARKANQITPEDKQEVERWVDEMEKLWAQSPVSPIAPLATAASGAPQGQSAALSPPNAPAVEQTPTGQATGFPQTPQLSQAQAQASIVSAPESGRANPGRGLRIAGMACGALGVASIGAAIYFYTRASSYSDKVSSATTWNSSDYDAGKSAETMQWVFYGIGAGALVTGTVLYWLGYRDSTAPAQVSLSPMVAPGIGGLSAQGAF